MKPIIEVAIKALEDLLELYKRIQVGQEQIAELEKLIKKLKEKKE